MSGAGSIIIRGASPLGLPYTVSRAPLRRRAPFPWLASLRSLASVPCLLIHEIHKRLVLLEATQIVGERPHGIGPVLRKEPRDVRRDQDVRTPPERALRRERHRSEERRVEK